MTTKIDDGGPAYPTSLSAEGPFGGMTHRDYFAAQAMAALLIAEHGQPAEIERRAYAYADGMIDVRNGGEG